MTKSTMYLESSRQNILLFTEHFGKIHPSIIKEIFNWSIRRISIDRIGQFCNVFKFYAYSVYKRLFLTTAKLARGLPDLATTNVCKVNTSNRNPIERNR